MRFFFCLIAQIPYRFFSRIFTSYSLSWMNRIILCGFRHEKTAGRSPLTQSLQRGILRVSEIFGYDENKYPGGVLQRAAGGCKAVSILQMKSSRSSLLKGLCLLSSAGSSRYPAGVCWNLMRGRGRSRANESGTAESLIFQGLCLLLEQGTRAFSFQKHLPRDPMQKCQECQEGKGNRRNSPCS